MFENVNVGDKIVVYAGDWSRVGTVTSVAPKTFVVNRTQYRKSDGISYPGKTGTKIRYPNDAAEVERLEAQQTKEQQADIECEEDPKTILGREVAARLNDGEEWQDLTIEQLKQIESWLDADA